jgi:CubicO group peptidase (beta-lactamase class C family)
MTKSVTTALVGIAVEEGLVDSIHDPIEKYIPEAAGTAWEGTTVEDLLQMESGIYWVDVPVHQPEELILMGLDFHTNGLYGMTRDEYLLRLTRVSPPASTTATTAPTPRCWPGCSRTSTTTRTRRSCPRRSGSRPGWRATR